jgi:hypothetical protein
MGEILNIFLTASLTLIGGIILLLLEKIVVLFYISPFWKFKKKLIKTKVTLYLYNNIFTNFFELEKTNEIFLQKIKDSQELLRNHWAELLVDYNQIINNPLLNFFCKRKIPTKEEMEIIAKNLIFVYNSPLVWSKSWKTEIKNNSLERNKKLEEIIIILMRY